MQSLRFLTKLAISFPKIAYVYINPEKIFKLKHLTHLHLGTYQFIKISAVLSGMQLLESQALEAWIDWQTYST